MTPLPDLNPDATYRGQRVPDGVRESLTDYAGHRVEPGGFLRAVLANDLMEAVGRADEYNLASLAAICGFIYSELPSPCHGSYEAVAAWLAARKAVEPC